ncbi:hypothetical protein ROZALSC1DRAFT_22378 [Rozella allomycis CSF55]|uniref:Uncharacterized protein n=1 Tax=Rozella allomycis (strain CSF55) TaxID=988480 RepID=A0A4P9YKF4_ROZAC|nr:hypothetical protein ROZALSC1DRAFT_22378 [Rozella allomycis CSF55]
MTVKKEFLKDYGLESLTNYEQKLMENTLICMMDNNQIVRKGTLKLFAFLKEINFDFNKHISLIHVYLQSSITHLDLGVRTDSLQFLDLFEIKSPMFLSLFHSFFTSKTFHLKAKLSIYNYFYLYLKRCMSGLKAKESIANFDFFNVESEQKCEVEEEILKKILDTLFLQWIEHKHSLSMIQSSSEETKYLGLVLNYNSLPFLQSNFSAWMKSHVFLYFPIHKSDDAELSRLNNLLCELVSILSLAVPENIFSFISENFTDLSQSVIAYVPLPVICDNFISLKSGIKKISLISRIQNEIECIPPMVLSQILFVLPRLICEFSSKNETETVISIIDLFKLIRELLADYDNNRLCLLMCPIFYIKKLNKPGPFSALSREIQTKVLGLLYSFNQIDRNLFESIILCFNSMSIDKDLINLLLSIFKWDNLENETMLEILANISRLAQSEKSNEWDFENFKMILAK